MSSSDNKHQSNVLPTMGFDQNASTLPPTNIQVYDSSLSWCMLSSLYSFDSKSTKSIHTKSATKKMENMETEKKQRRQRTAFTTEQHHVLLESYNESRYPKQTILNALISKLSLSKRQITVWFQNRRVKSRREEFQRLLKDTKPSTSLLSEDKTETSSNVLSVNSLSHKNCDGSIGKMSTNLQLNQNFGFPYLPYTAHLDFSYQQVSQISSVTNESFNESAKTSDISSTPILNSFSNMQFSNPSYIPLYPPTPLYPNFFNLQFTQSSIYPAAPKL